MSKLVFLLGLTLLAVASARVTRDAPPKPELTLESVFDSVKDGLSKLGDTILTATGSADAEDLQKKTMAQFTAAKERIATWVEGAQADTERMKDSPLIQDLRNALEKLSNDFKTEHPTLVEGVSEEIKKAQGHVDEVVQKIKALEDSEEAKKFKETTDKLLETAKAQVEGLAADLKLTPKTK